MDLLPDLSTVSNEQVPIQQQRNLRAAGGITTPSPLRCVMMNSSDAQSYCSGLMHWQDKSNAHFNTIAKRLGMGFLFITKPIGGKRTERHSYFPYLVKLRGSILR
eukprot:scaffold677035_cov76-Prasinocladus_malaysianus.AAC.1